MDDDLATRLHCQGFQQTFVLMPGSYTLKKIHVQVEKVPPMRLVANFDNKALLFEESFDPGHKRG